MKADFNTPTSSKIRSNNQSTSPKRFSSTIESRRTNASQILHQNTQTLVQESAHSSLIQKIIQSKISASEGYQSLLILNTQLDIKLLGLEEEAQKLRKTFKQVNKPIQELKTKLEKERRSLIEKQKYLKKFYTHLDSKLRTNMQSNLFNKIQKIQAALQQKFQKERQELYATLSVQHQKIQAENAELQKLRQYRDDLIKEYTVKIISVNMMKAKSQKNSHSQSGKNTGKSIKGEAREPVKSSSKASNAQKISQNKSSNSNTKAKLLKSKKQQKQNAKIQIEEQCRFLKQNMKKLSKQKDGLQKSEKVLKILLNIDEEHKKYSTYIINGYKKLFTIKYRELLIKKRTEEKFKQVLQQKEKEQKSEQRKGHPQLSEVQKLQKQLTEKIQLRKILQKQVQSRNKGLQKCKQKLNEEIGKYSDLEQMLLSSSNRNANSNSRMSYNSTEPSQSHHNRMTYSPDYNGSGFNYQ